MTDTQATIAAPARQAADGQTPGKPHIEVRSLTMAYDSVVVMRNVHFTVNRGDIFFIVGPSGSGKSTLMRHMIGLNEPVEGEVLYDGVSFTRADADTRDAMLRNFGVSYQGGALFSSMTLAENIAMPLAEYTDLNHAERMEIAALKLSWVGLKGFEDYYPSEISGGMQKRAALARALALDPDVLFFDEPSSGLDPVSSSLLDDLILQLRDNLGATIVIVSHELPSIFRIGTNSVYLDVETRTQAAVGNPRYLLEHCDNPRVHSFLTRRAQFERSARNHG
ncbi:MAG TPA: ATP-binding cassette domain-containing protein [Candidatus Binataceae bacterium]|nr:ATP-binding cassette domain-containing protein [Candidatus Binataceae bacterium]